MWLRGPSHITWPTAAWLLREAETGDEIAGKPVVPGYATEGIGGCPIRSEHWNCVYGGKDS